MIMALRERTAYPMSLLERLPNLKLLTTAGMGNASIDVEAATGLGILVCGTAGSSRTTMELTWGLILGLMRHIPGEHAATRAGSWQRTVGAGLEGKTLGLIGLGNIGGQMAEVGRAFHMRLVAWSQNLTSARATECEAELVSKDELLSQADVVSIHLKLSDRTRGLLAERELRLMKSTAILVNTSRGPIVDEAALVSLLRAGLDRRRWSRRLRPGAAVKRTPAADARQRAFDASPRVRHRRNLRQVLRADRREHPGIS